MKIKTARKKAGLTQTQLAQRCGWAMGTIQQYEREIRQPSIERLGIIAKALGITVYEMIGSDWAGIDLSDAFRAPEQPSADELAEYLQAVHDNPKLGVLFKRGRNATPEKLDAILALLGSDEDEQY